MLYNEGVVSLEEYLASPEYYVIIDADRHIELVISELWEQALFAVGVAKWEGFDKACKIFEQLQVEAENNCEDE